MGGETLDETLPTDSESHISGYAWLDSIQRIADWKKSTADPLQISNTPLVHRPGVVPSHTTGTSNVLLMHDAHYEGYDGAQGGTTLIDRYTLEHWQSVEIFVYFGHKRAMVPPVSWINSGHRNGALVLGTFCCEGKYSDNGRILDKRPDGKTYVLADALAQIAHCYGFDGWFINIESEGDYLKPMLKDNGAPLVELLQQLKSGLPTGGKVIWYVLHYCWF